MNENEEYNLGYFEGIREVYMAFATFQHHDDHSLALQRFLEWIAAELEDARKLMDEEEE